MWSTNYHNVSSGQFNTAENELSTFKFTGNEKILDIGCGTGKITHLCAQYVPSGTVLGIDNSATMIGFAELEYKDTKNLNFIVEDICELNIDKSFDIIFSFYCLHWVNDKQKAINNIFNMLKLNGALSNLTFNNDQLIAFDFKWACERPPTDVQKEAELKSYDTWLIKIDQNLPEKLQKYVD